MPLGSSLAEFGPRSLDSLRREELQALLEEKAASGLSCSMVNHMRWDLNEIFEMTLPKGT